MTQELQWLAWAKELQSIGQIGLTYCRDPHDRQRFQRIRDLSVQIMERHTGMNTERLTELFASETGYQTPKADVRAAIYREGRILMVQERTDGKWTLPGGWADVGCTLSQSITREAWEEALVRVKPRRVIAVLDRAAQGHPVSPYSSYKIFMQADLVAMEPFVPNIETSAREFFSAGDLPVLSEQRITAAQIEMCFAARGAEHFECVFD